MLATRRTLLALGAGAAAGAVLGGRCSGRAQAADLYPSNTALYRDPSLSEGIDYARRYLRQGVFDDCSRRGTPFVRSVILAPHGGGLEPGTSELCLAVAGYHPATRAVTPLGVATHDYWMFEGIRASGNSELHVTSTHCDDGVAVSLCAGARNALGLHGCATASVGLPDGTQAALVGGRNDVLKERLLTALSAAGITALDAAGVDAIDGDHPDNIANRTLLGMGAHLELTLPLRQAMFDVNTQSQRKDTTTELFWSFVAACRAAIAETEADQPIL